MCPLLSPIQVLFRGLGLKLEVKHTPSNSVYIKETEVLIEKNHCRLNATGL